VRALAERGVYPGPAAINRERGKREPVSNNLNGRDCSERERVLLELGWTYDGSKRPRTWRPPDAE